MCYTAKSIDDVRNLILATRDHSADLGRDRDLRRRGPRRCMFAGGAASHVLVRQADRFEDRSAGATGVTPCVTRLMSTGAAVALRTITRDSEIAVSLVRR
jgi:hypothetical protein